MELKEMIKVMQHFENGGEIEFSNDKFKTTLGEANKKDDSDLGWNWEDFTYRIKGPKEKVIIETWLIKDKSSSEYFTIESSNVDLTLEAFPNGCKVKLIGVYAVEV